MVFVHRGSRVGTGGYLLGPLRGGEGCFSWAGGFFHADVVMNPFHRNLYVDFILGKILTRPVIDRAIRVSFFCCVSENRLGDLRVDAAEVQVSLGERDFDSGFGKHPVHFGMQLIDGEDPIFDGREEAP